MTSIEFCQGEEKEKERLILYKMNGISVPQVPMYIVNCVRTLSWKIAKYWFFFNKILIRKRLIGVQPWDKIVMLVFTRCLSRNLSISLLSDCHLCSLVPSSWKSFNPLQNRHCIIAFTAPCDKSHLTCVICTYNMTVIKLASILFSDISSVNNEPARFVSFSPM